MTARQWLIERLPPRPTTCWEWVTAIAWALLAVGTPLLFALVMVFGDSGDRPPTYGEQGTEVVSR